VLSLFFRRACDKGVGGRNLLHYSTGGILQLARVEHDNWVFPQAAVA
jgi:hypothetical protein